MLGSTFFVTYLTTNPHFLAGPFWGTASPCCTDSAALGSLEPGSKAEDGSPGLYDTVWKPTILPHVPKELQWSGLATVDGGEVSAKGA